MKCIVTSFSWLNIMEMSWKRIFYTLKFTLASHTPDRDRGINRKFSQFLPLEVILLPYLLSQIHKGDSRCLFTGFSVQTSGGRPLMGAPTASIICSIMKII